MVDEIDGRTTDATLSKASSSEADEVSDKDDSSTAASGSTTSDPESKENSID